MACLIKSVCPIGASGLWKVERFTVSEERCNLHNLRCSLRGRRQAMIYPDTYTRLSLNGEVVMSDTPYETRKFDSDAFSYARGDILVNGLGLGLAVIALLRRPEVTSITVNEIDLDVIQLTGGQFKDDPRVTINGADAYTWTPPGSAASRKKRYTMAWHDIWPSICSNNREGMTRLRRRYSKWCLAQYCWSEDEIR